MLQTRISSCKCVCGPRRALVAPCRPAVVRRSVVAVRASAAPQDEDAEFERKLAALQKKSRPASAPKPAAKAAGTGTGKSKKKEYDFTGEEVYFDGGPSGGDVAVNVALGATLLWLPLTIGSVTRALFVKYRFTDKRVSVITNAPWQKERADAPYQEVQDVRVAGRGIGLWGDMVVVLRNGDKVEMRALPRFLELKKYILDRRDALLGDSADSPAAAAAKGFL